MEGDDFGPTKAELDREAYLDWLEETYEARYQEFCRHWHLDPYDTRSVLAYEEAWEEETSGDRDEDWQPG